MICSGTTFCRVYFFLRVALDGDLRNPAIHRQFEVHLEPGFSEALRGEVPFEEVIRPTSLGRLSVVPAGLCDPATIRQFEAVLAWALKVELPRGALLERIQQAGGVPELLSEFSRTA